MNQLREIIKNLLPKTLKYNYRLLRKYGKKKRLERAYAGNNVECLICGHQYRIFEPFKNIENEKCTNCISMKRHRLLYKYLIEETNLFNKNSVKKRLLHFAPEKAFYDLFTKQSNIDYYPGDIEPTLYQFYRNTKINNVDITNISFPDNYFDVILCNHVLEHIIKDKEAMAELFRVLKKDGWGIFQVPIDFNREETYEDFSKITPEERYKAFGQVDHVRWYGNDYPKRLSQAGFEVYDIRYTDQFSKEEKFRYGFPEEESVYLCRKK